MDYFANFVRRIGVTFVVIGACFMVGTMLVVVANIVTRLFDIPILGTYEAVELMIVVAGASALGYCALMQGHVIVNIVLIRLRQPIQTILAIFTTFLSLGVWALIAWKGAEFAGKQWLVGEQTTVMRWPVYPLRYVFVLGVIVLCLVLFVDLFKALRESAKK